MKKTGILFYKVIGSVFPRAMRRIGPMGQMDKAREPDSWRERTGIPLPRGSRVIPCSARCPTCPTGPTCPTKVRVTPASNAMPQSSADNEANEANKANGPGANTGLMAREDRNTTSPGISRHAVQCALVRILRTDPYQSVQVRVPRASPESLTDFSEMLYFK